jgi:HAD superfamily hydrolase (TIGR01450 family)
MPYPDLLSLRPHVQSSEGVLIDLDGTLMSCGQLYPDTKRFLASLDRPFMILSNDSEHTSEQLEIAFRHHGVPLRPGQLMLAGVALVEELAKTEPGARVMILGSPALRALAKGKGLQLTDNRPAAVIVMRDPGFNYQRLATAARALDLGARLIVACPDVSYPGPSGEPIPEAGALAAALRACTGRDEFRVFGKPEPTMFDLATQRLGVPASACIMIGDNPATDGMGARQLGMTFYQILRSKDESGERIV